MVTPLPDDADVVLTPPDASEAQGERAEAEGRPYDSYGASALTSVPPGQPAP